MPRPRGDQRRRMPWNAPPPVMPAPWPVDAARTPSSPAVTRVLVIASLPRSGSTLLSRALGATGEVGVPEEYFEPSIMGSYRDTWGLPRLTMHGRAGIIRRRVTGQPSWWDSYRYTRPSLERYRDIIVGDTVSPSGRFAVKMHRVAYHAFEGGPLDPLTWGRPVDWIHLTRSDVLRQAISFVRARQTKAWVADAQATGVARYDGVEIVRWIRRFGELERDWQRFFVSRGITALEVSYEDLAADYAGQVRRVLDYLELPATPVPPPPIARQADETTEEWAARFVREYGAVEDLGA